MADREFKEQPITQGEDEQIVYTLTTTPWGSSPTSVVVSVKNERGTTIASLLGTGGSSIDGDVITTPEVKNLVAGETYRLEIKFTVDGNILEAWGKIIAEA